MSAFQFLLLEANLTDAEVVQATLIEGGINCELLRVETCADFIRTLETDEIDLILADYALSNFDEIAALTIARRLRPEKPFIFISGSLGEELAIEAIKQGATDYVLKQRLGRLVPSVQRALLEAQQLDKNTIARKQAEATVESDLKDTQLLHELSARLVTEGDIQTLYQEIIAVAIALMQADAGTVQILDEATQDLLLLATQGIERNMSEHFYRVNADLNTPCGIALATGKRTFINYDVPESEDPHGSCRMHLEAGYLFAQSTPLITRSGKTIGMFSTHWRKHHRPSDRELRFLDLLARQAADLIEQRQAQVALRESEAKLAIELADTQQLQRISSSLIEENNINAFHEQILDAARSVMRSDMASIQMLSPERNELFLLAQQGFAPESAKFWEWVQLEDTTSCALALTRGEPVIVPDVELWDFVAGTEDIWHYRLCGIRAMQSTPLISRDGHFVGMISTHWRDVHQPSERELRFLDLLARQAADLIEQRQAQVALRESEEKFRTLFNLIDEGFCIFELLFDGAGNAVDWIYTEANPAFEQQTGYINPIGQRISHFQPDLERSWFERFAEVARTGSPVRFVQYTEAMGIWYDVYALRVGGSGDNRVSLLFTDITDRKRHEANQSLLVEIGDDLSRLITPDEIMQSVGSRLGAYLNLSACIFVDVDEERGLVTVNHGWNREHVPSLKQTFRLTDYLTEEFARANRAGETFVIRNTADDERTDADAHARLKIGAFLVVPFHSSGRWTGYLAVTDTAPRDWREDEIELVRNIADRIFPRVERARIENALRESEEKYRTLFESIDEGFYFAEAIFDAEGRCVDIFYLDENPAAVRMIGQSAKGRRMSELAPYEQYWRDVFGETARTGQPQRREEYAAPDGIWYEFYVFKPQQAQENQFVLIFSDVTERRRSQEALRESEAKYRSLFESINDGFCVIEVIFDQNEKPIDYRFLEISPSFERQTGLTDALGKRMRELVPNHEEYWFEIYGNVALSGQSVRLENYARELQRWFDIYAFPVGKPEDRQVAVVFSVINDRKQAEENRIRLIREQAAREEERQRAESLAELDRAKTNFFGNVSHEFRTPLTLLLAPLQDALSDSANPLTQKQRERLELAHRNSLRLLKLVNTLLDFSRIEANRLKANYEPTDLSTYTAELASVFCSAIENANLQLVVDCPPLPDPIYVDREMWEKIVLNLLSNALKFTFEGMISVSLKPKANTVELTVSDTGVGISASELPHLFERFYQVKGAKGRSYEGSGIGLSLVQELVKRHGGAIAVTSAVDQGTTFTVTIPTGIAHLPADQIWVASTLASTAVTANAFVEEALRWLPEESTEFQFQTSEVQAQSSKVHAQNSKVQAQNSKVQAQSSEVQAPGSKRARILLVDDNADMRGYLRRLLNQYYEVETVNDGLAALTAIRRGGSAIYDLVLADVMMPKMDGFELLRSLRASPNTQTIPIILLSARAGEESRVEGLETGADDYLIKPFSARELLARVNANLQLAQLRREAAYREQVMQAVQTLNERLEQQVKARTAQLEAINQELEAFSSSISHDLRTPLRYIRSFAEQLQAKLNATLVDASSLQILNIITQSALEAEKMVDNLLEFSRLGQTEMYLTTVNISQLVQQVQEQLQLELVGRSLHWEIQPLATVEADPVLLRLVLQNLLSNAVKYTRNNTEAAITIGSIEQEQKVIFFVKDNGAGFDMKYCDRLFNIFQRLHPQEEFPGTGVGLATVRRIIHRHGGHIWAEGAIDQGATFYFSLPKHEV
ncbi:MAG: ATP-binding protein [Nostoc sp.]|uniref:ATP-binding protein n=1 Tax=Nostoc sp. TaxID=1180 RepID=UPI002FFA84E0